MVLGFRFQGFMALGRIWGYLGAPDDQKALSREPNPVSPEPQISPPLPGPSDLSVQLLGIKPYLEQPSSRYVYVQLEGEWMGFWWVYYWFGGY